MTKVIGCKEESCYVYYWGEEFRQRLETGRNFPCFEHHFQTNNKPVKIIKGVSFFTLLLYLWARADKKF